MNLYELINNAEYDVICGELNYTKHIIILEEKEYRDVYREIGDKSTFLLVDKKGNVNFFIKLEDGFSLEQLIECEPQIYADKEACGPEVVVNFGLNNEFTAFTLELDNKYDLFVIKKLLESRDVYYQYIMQDEYGIIKLFSKGHKIEEEFIERLKYMLEFSYYGMYPRIKRAEDDNKEAYFISISRDIYNLETVIDTIDEFGKMGYSDEFNVHVDMDEYYKIIFSGDIPNIEKIRNGMLRKINIINEGISPVSGKPLLKYKSGLLYFFESSSENCIEDEKLDR